jgi:HEPN domain-containing protein
MTNSVLAWLQYAEKDNKARKVLFKAEGLDLIYVFHCHQAIEKALKALLLKWEIDPPKSHDLNKLLSLLPENVMKEFQDKQMYLNELNIIYIDSRYPSGFAQFPNDFVSQEELESIEHSTDELYHKIVNLTKADSISKD